MKLKYGYPIKKWKEAKRQVREVLIEGAKARDVISSFELAVRVTAIQLEPQSFALTIMLREIAADENRADRHSRLQLRRHAAWPGIPRFGWSPGEKQQRHAKVLDKGAQAGLRLLGRGKWKVNGQSRSVQAYVRQRSS